MCGPENNREEQLPGGQQHTCSEPPNTPAQMRKPDSRAVLAQILGLWEREKGLRAT